MQRRYLRVCKLINYLKCHRFSIGMEVDNMTVILRNACAYQMAQKALVDIKTSIYKLLEAAPEPGLTNVEIGSSLGIYGARRT